MEGGSPALIWERWTLPMYYAQLRYWGDHPRVDQLLAAKMKLKPRKTPPRKPGDSGNAKIDWSLLKKPLTDAERGAPKGRSTKI